MAYNNQYNKPSGNRNFERRDFNRPSVYTRQGGDRPMFKAVCAECGKECEVPFRPSGDRPVFCSNCFEQKRGGSDSRRPDDRNFSRSRFEGDSNPVPQNNEQLNTINAKLDKILGLLNPTLEVKPEVKAIEVEKPQEVIVTKEPKVKVEKKKKTSKK